MPYIPQRRFRPGGFYRFGNYTPPTPPPTPPRPSGSATGRVGVQPSAQERAAIEARQNAARLQQRGVGGGRGGNVVAPELAYRGEQMRRPVKPVNFNPEGQGVLSRWVTDDVFGPANPIIQAIRNFVAPEPGTERGQVSSFLNESLPEEFLGVGLQGPGRLTDMIDAIVHGLTNFAAPGSSAYTFEGRGGGGLQGAGFGAGAGGGGEELPYGGDQYAATEASGTSRKPSEMTWEAYLDDLAGRGLPDYFSLLDQGMGAGGGGGGGGLNFGGFGGGGSPADLAFWLDSLRWLIGGG